VSPLPADNGFLNACRRQNVRLTRFVLVVSVAHQHLWVCESATRRTGGRTAPCPTAIEASWLDRSIRTFSKRYKVRRHFRISTSRYGVGQRNGSNQTPLGLHRIGAKVGLGWPIGTVFKGRQPIGLTWQGLPDAAIAHRVLWLEGLEAGFNKGGDVDSRSRFIYLHGVGDETTLGRPNSRGCIHLPADALIALADLLPSGTLVWIQAR
jgi:L,D-transpeptidase YbiS